MHQKTLTLCGSLVKHTERMQKCSLLLLVKVKCLITQHQTVYLTQYNVSWASRVSPGCIFAVLFGGTEMIHCSFNSVNNLINSWKHTCSHYVSSITQHSQCPELSDHRVHIHFFTYFCAIWNHFITAKAKMCMFFPIRITFILRLVRRVRFWSESLFKSVNVISLTQCFPWKPVQATEWKIKFKSHNFILIYSELGDIILQLQKIKP